MIEDFFQTNLESLFRIYLLLITSKKLHRSHANDHWHQKHLVGLAVFWDSSRRVARLSELSLKGKREPTVWDHS